MAATLHRRQQNGETLAGELATDLQSGQLDSTSTFVLVASSIEGCGDVVSNGLEFVVYDPLTIGEVSSDQTICYDTAPAPISCEGANGASGVHSYQWETNLLEGSWLPVPNQTSTIFTAGELTLSAHIRLTATDSAGCGSISSELVQIDVLDDWGPGIVQSTDELCFGDGFDIIAKGPSGADNDFPTCGMWRWTEAHFLRSTRFI